MLAWSVCAVCQHHMVIVMLIVSVFVVVSYFVLKCPVCCSASISGNVHVSWMNPNVIYDTKRSSFPNFGNRRHIYIGKQFFYLALPRKRLYTDLN